MSDENEAGAVPTDEDELRSLLERARGGEREALPALREALDRRPGFWQAYGDLAAHARDAWIGLASGPDLALKESLARQVASIREDAAGPSPTPLEGLLADRVAACWLQASYADAAATQVDKASVKQADFARKRQDSAHRRYLSAIAALAMVRKLLPSSDSRTPVAKEAESLTLIVPAPPSDGTGADPGRGRATPKRRRPSPTA